MYIVGEYIGTVPQDRSTSAARRIRDESVVYLKDPRIDFLYVEYIAAGSVPGESERERERASELPIFVETSAIKV